MRWKGLDRNFLGICTYHVISRDMITWYLSKEHKKADLELAPPQYWKIGVTNLKLRLICTLPTAWIRVTRAHTWNELSSNLPCWHNGQYTWKWSQIVLKWLRTAMKSHNTGGIPGMSVVDSGTTWCTGYEPLPPLEGNIVTSIHNARFPMLNESDTDSEWSFIAALWSVPSNVVDFPL